MLTGSDFWHLIEHIIPVYVLIFLGYALVKYDVLQGVHAPGINRYVSVVGIPSYVFYLLAFNDPYKVSMRLIGADVLQKAVALITGCLWWKFAKSGKIDHVINFVMLATLPNTVLIGEALLEPLYGEQVVVDVITIIFMQSTFWYNMVICLYELRVVLLSMKDDQAQRDGDVLPVQQNHMDGVPSRQSAVSIDEEGHTSRRKRDPVQHIIGQHQFVLKRTLSAPAFVPIVWQVIPLKDESSVLPVHFDDGTKNMSESTGDTFSPVATPPDQFLQSREPSITGSRRAGCENGIHEQAQSEMVNVDLDPVPTKQKRRKRVSNKIVFLRRVTFKVINRLKYAPLTYASVIGFVYSLFAFRFDWTMPYYIRTSVELICLGIVGMATLILGMSWASSGKLISCGFMKMTYGMFIRFLIGPVLMIVTSLVFGLKGDMFKISVLQAVIPQGVISFVLAKEYDVDVDVFSTAVIFQLIVFLPFIIAYYFILESV